MSLYKTTIRLDAETKKTLEFAAKATHRGVSQYVARAVIEQVRRDTVDSQCVNPGQAAKFVAFLRDSRIPSSVENVAKFLRAMIDSKMWDGKVA